MKRKKSIELLNKAVADELHAVHQYMYFHFHLDDLGYGPLAALECSANADAVSKQIFEGLVADEERHSDIFAHEVERLERFGEQYLALQSFETGEPATPAG